MCSSAPDMSGANQAALEQAQLSKDQLDWVKQVYNDTAAQRADTQARQNAVSDAQLGLMKQQSDLTTEASDRYRTVFQPIEDKIAADAQSYDTPAREEQAAGQAAADVQQQADIQAANTQCEQAAMGVDPSSGAATQAAAQAGAVIAAARASSANAARKQVQTIGAAKMADAAALGHGVSSSQATTAGIALNAGNSSAGTSGSANATGMSGAPMVQQGYSTAINGLGGASNNLADIGKVQAGIDSSNSAGMGAAVGGIAMAI